MGRNVPVPAESLRCMAEGAMAEVRLAREDGRKATAKSLQNDISVALDAAAGKDGEFASVPKSTASSLAAFGGASDVPEHNRHNNSVTTFLKQYDYW